MLSTTGLQTPETHKEEHLAMQQSQLCPCCDDYTSSIDGFEGSGQVAEPEGLGSSYSTVRDLLRSPAVG